MSSTHRAAASSVHSTPGPWSASARVRWSDPTGGPYLGIASPTEGYVPADQLDPEDSTGPRAWEIDPDPLAFSPDGDGSIDTLGVDVTWSEDADWTAKVEAADGADLETWSGDGGTASFTWSGLGAGGSPLPDGSYRLTVRASDALGNDGAATTRTVTIDTDAPTLDLTGAAADASGPEAARTFTPNGDDQADVLDVGYDVSQGGTLELVVRDASDVVVRRTFIGTSAGPGSVDWDGRNDDGGSVPDGRYEVRLRAKDRAGNTSDAVRTHALVLKALKGVARTAARIYPADGDNLAASTTISFSLTKPATLDWTILRPDGTVLRDEVRRLRRSGRRLQLDLLAWHRAAGARYHPRMSPQRRDPDGRIHTAHSVGEPGREADPRGHGGWRVRGAAPSGETAAARGRLGGRGVGDGPSDAAQCRRRTAVDRVGQGGPPAAGRDRAVGRACSANVIALPGTYAHEADEPGRGGECRHRSVECGGPDGTPTPAASRSRGAAWTA